MDILKKLARNRSKTLIIVTHDQNIANMTDEIINISDGKITRIRDVAEEQDVHGICLTLDIRQGLVNLLFDGGYDSVEKILELNETKLGRVKGLKKKDRSHLMNRITKARKKLLGKYGAAKVEAKSADKKTCPHCGKDLFVEGAKFCPFCASKI